MSELDGIRLVTDPVTERLNARQQTDYERERRDCAEWLLAFGKEPDQAVGYAHTTVAARFSRMDQFYRFVWEREDGYTTAVTHDHADAWMKHLARRDVSNGHRNACQKAVRMLFRWRAHECGGAEWEPNLRFSCSDQSTTPRDYLTRDERTAIREAALEFDSVPDYDSISPTERDRWRAHLAQRFGKPKADVTPRDWERANGWEYPSLLWTSLDAGLRPVEVKRARIGWVDVDNGVLRIPKEEASKNVEHWVVGLTERTAAALKRWLEERTAEQRYDETDRLWLTREGNPWSSASLSGLIDRVAAVAGIDHDNRRLTWYSIRHSVGTYMTREEDLAAAQAQLRHKCPETTMKYDQVPVEDRQEALDRMG